MLILDLTLDNGQVIVRANKLQSHTFSRHGLNVDLKDFVKDPLTYGEKLFQALFKDGSEARTAFDDFSKQTERTIVIVLESSELDGIAWEYAYHDNAYVVEDFAFMRALPEKERPHSNGRLSKSIERLPLLFMPANPLVDLSGEPMRELDIESEWHEMTQRIVESNAPFDLIELRPATPAALQSVMARFQNGMIAHFSGHGAATKDGAFLLFENENGSSNPLEAREFVREVKDQAWIGFLSACQSAVAERTEYSNLARELVKAGVSFALGMQFNLPDLFAPNISGQFYNYLSQGHAVPEAARQARRAVKRENEFYVGMIALYAAHPDEAGKMGWSGSGARTLSTFAAADVSDLPTPSGFIGRQRELMNIGTHLLEKKKPNTVTLHGAGGIGKTALMRQALLRFAPSFESALAIALDPLPSLESVLGRLERFLNLPSPCSNDTKEREKIVRERLTSKHTLLGLDNFETLNYALNDKDSDEEKTAKSLHSFFKYLAANGAILCITSREVTNLGGELIIDIEGLPHDIGGRLFQDNVIRQKDEIYIEKTQLVSEMVGGHPLALRLLASAFDDQIETSLDQYIEDLQSHLPKARDKWTEEDRHESLRASFDFSMSNLLKTKEGRELQIALSRLSVFTAFFATYIVAPTLAGKWYENDNEEKSQQNYSQKITHALWERGLLERTTLPLRDQNYYLYRLHPALNQFTAEQVTSEDLPVMQETHQRAMRQLADRAYATSEGSGIYGSPFIAALVRFSIPDLLKASTYQQNKETSTLLFHTAFIQRHFGNLDEAMRMCQQSLEINEGLGDLQGKSATLHQMAGIYVTRGDLEGAIKLYQQSLEIFEGLGDLQGKSATLYAMANIYVTRGDLGGAMKLYQQSLEINEELGYLKGKPSTLTAMGRILHVRGDLDGAMKLYQQSLEINEKLGDLKNKAVTIGEMASIHIFRGNFDEGLNLNQEKLAVVKSLGDKREEAVAVSWIAYIENARGDSDKALSLYQEALKINKGLHNIDELSRNLLQIAGIYVKRGDLDQAMNLYEQALANFEQLGYLQGKSATIHEMARIHVIRKDLDKAMKLFQQSLEINESLGNLAGKSATLVAMAGVYITLRDLEGAMDLYQQSLEIDERLGNLQDKAIILNNMGVVLSQNNQYEKALRCFFDAKNTFEKMRVYPSAQAVANSLIQVRHALGSEKFDRLWNEVIKQSLPDWLA